MVSVFGGLFVAVFLHYCVTDSISVLVTSSLQVLYELGSIIGKVYFIILAPYIKWVFSNLLILGLGFLTVFVLVWGIINFYNKKNQAVSSIVVSPHLSVYRSQCISTSSILHRISGGLLVVMICFYFFSSKFSISLFPLEDSISLDRGYYYGLCDSETGSVVSQHLNFPNKSLGATNYSNFSVPTNTDPYMDNTNFLNMLWSRPTNFLDMRDGTVGTAIYNNLFLGNNHNCWFNDSKLMLGGTIRSFSNGKVLGGDVFNGNTLDYYQNLTNNEDFLWTKKLSSDRLDASLSQFRAVGRIMWYHFDNYMCATAAHPVGRFPRMFAYGEHLLTNPYHLTYGNSLLGKDPFVGTSLSTWSFADTFKLPGYSSYEDDIILGRNSCHLNIPYKFQWSGINFGTRLPIFDATLSKNSGLFRTFYFVDVSHRGSYSNLDLPYLASKLCHKGFGLEEWSSSHVYNKTGARRTLRGFYGNQVLSGEFKNLGSDFSNNLTPFSNFRNFGLTVVGVLEDRHWIRDAINNMLNMEILQNSALRFIITKPIGYLLSDYVTFPYDAEVCGLKMKNYFLRSVMFPGGTASDVLCPERGANAIMPYYNTGRTSTAATRFTVPFDGNKELYWDDETFLGFNNYQTHNFVDTGCISKNNISYPMVDYLKYLKNPSLFSQHNMAFSDKETFFGYSMYTKLKSFSTVSDITSVRSYQYRIIDDILVPFMSFMDRLFLDYDFLTWLKTSVLLENLGDTHASSGFLDSEIQDSRSNFFMAYFILPKFKVFCTEFLSKGVYLLVSLGCLGLLLYHTLHGMQHWIWDNVSNYFYNTSQKDFFVVASYLIVIIFFWLIIFLGAF